MRLAAVVCAGDVAMRVVARWTIAAHGALTDPDRLFTRLRGLVALTRRAPDAVAPTLDALTQLLHSAHGGHERSDVWRAVIFLANKH